MRRGSRPGSPRSVNHVLAVGPGDSPQMPRLRQHAHVPDGPASGVQEGKEFVRGRVAVHTIPLIATTVR
jgi:hypothetical protein